MKAMMIAILGLAAAAAGSAALGQGSAVQPPAFPRGDSWLIWAAAIGLLTGYIGHRAARSATTAGALRFCAVGAIGGVGGALLALHLMSGAYMTPGKFMSAVIVGAAVGAWILAYVLRILHPADKG